MSISTSEIIITIFSLIVTPLTTLIFMSNTQRKLICKKQILFAIAMPIFIVTGGLYLTNILSRIVTTVIYQAIIIISALFISKDKWINKIINLIIFYTLLTFLDYFTYSVIRLIPFAPTWMPTVVMSLLMIFALYFAEQYIKGLRDKTFGKEGVVFLLIPFGQLVVFFSIGILFNVLFPYHLNMMKTDVFANASAIILLFSITVFLLVDIIAFKQYIKNLDLAKVEARNKLLEYQNELNLNYFNELKENETELRKIKHDISGCLETMKEIIYTEHDIEKSQSFFNELAHTVGNISTGFYCNNSLINAIITSKSRICKKQNIRLNVEIRIPNEFNIADSDICRVLVNLLDNAIEANEKLEGERFINFSLTEANGFVYISTRNPFDKEIIDYQTTKDNKKEHGFGIKILNDFAKKYNGYYKADIDNNTLLSLVVLENAVISPETTAINTKNK